jgi:hypothetical protein
MCAPAPHRHCAKPADGPLESNHAGFSTRLAGRHYLLLLYSASWLSNLPLRCHLGRPDRTSLHLVQLNHYGASHHPDSLANGWRLDFKSRGLRDIGAELRAAARQKPGLLPSRSISRKASDAVNWMRSCKWPLFLPLDRYRIEPNPYSEALRPPHLFLCNHWDSRAARTTPSIFSDGKSSERFSDGGGAKSSRSWPGR